MRGVVDRIGVGEALMDFGFLNEAPVWVCKWQWDCMEQLQTGRDDNDVDRATKDDATESLKTCPVCQDPITGRKEDHIGMHNLGFPYLKEYGFCTSLSLRLKILVFSLCVQSLLELSKVSKFMRTLPYTNATLEICGENYRYKC